MVGSELAVDPLMFVSHFIQFIFIDAPLPANLIMDNIWIAVVSENWRHMNNHLFKGGVIDHSEIFSLAQLKFWPWISSKLPYGVFPLFDRCLKSHVCMLSIKKRF